ncbi:MAG: hypothetical protein ACKOPK_15035, partial [Dolichospermum sp.]
SSGGRSFAINLDSSSLKGKFFRVKIEFDKISSTQIFLLLTPGQNPSFKFVYCLFFLLKSQLF